MKRLVINRKTGEISSMGSDSIRFDLNKLPHDTAYKDDIAKARTKGYQIKYESLKEAIQKGKSLIEASEIFIINKHTGEIKATYKDIKMAKLYARKLGSNFDAVTWDEKRKLYAKAEALEGGFKFRDLVYQIDPDGFPDKEQKGEIRGNAGPGKYWVMWLGANGLPTGKPEKISGFDLMKVK
jgi:hypothetical protein